MARPKSFTPIDKTCPQCDSVWYASTWYQVKKQVFCSNKCMGMAARERKLVERFERPCKTCGKKMQILPCHRFTKWYCSRSCANTQTSKGEGNGSWKGGSDKYWKRQARERDNFTCQFPGCGKRSEGKGMHAHHKVPSKAGGSDDLDNLTTLCNRHHREMERQFLIALIKKSPAVSQRVASEIYTW